MKTLLVALAVFALAISAIAAGLPRDPDSNAVVQGHFTPDGKKERALTNPVTAVDMRTDAVWAVYSNATSCRFRTMSTTVKKGIKHPVPQNTWMIRGVNQSTPFLSFTGCKTTVLQRQ